MTEFSLSNLQFQYVEQIENYQVSPMFKMIIE